jgi:CheY-like chemotaxis protein
MSPQDNITLSEADVQSASTDGEPQICVLLAEDDRALRRFLEVLLARAGYKVVVASDGLEAMKLLLSSRVDVVVTDAIMPKLSGHELCRFLRDSPSLSHLPIILLSGLEGQDSPANLGQVDRFLSKPIAGEELIDCIQRLTAQK